MPTPHLHASAMPATVLLVESEPQVAELKRALLVRAGFGVKLANTGSDGLRQAQAETPAAVILDTDLAGMDGFEVCRRLKADAQTKHLPVLVCSASPNARELAHQAGANDFLVKPDEVMRLPERVARLLGADGIPPVGAIPAA